MTMKDGRERLPPACSYQVTISVGDYELKRYGRVLLIGLIHIMGPGVSCR